MSGERAELLGMAMVSVMAEPVGIAIVSRKRGGVIDPPSPDRHEIRIDRLFQLMDPDRGFYGISPPDVMVSRREWNRIFYDFITDLRQAAEAAPAAEVKHCATE